MEGKIERNAFRAHHSFIKNLTKKIKFYDFQFATPALHYSDTTQRRPWFEWVVVRTRSQQPLLHGVFFGAFT